MIMVKCDLCDWAGYFGFGHMFFFFLLQLPCYMNNTITA